MDIVIPLEIIRKKESGDYMSKISLSYKEEDK